MKIHNVHTLKRVKSCDECPLQVDPDPRPTYCAFDREATHGMPRCLARMLGSFIHEGDVRNALDKALEVVDEVLDG